MRFKTALIIVGIALILLGTFEALSLTNWFVMDYDDYKKGECTFKKYLDGSARLPNCVIYELNQTAFRINGLHI